jgi:glycosyltransferase involved in cell wall biosynthesis
VKVYVYPADDYGCGHHRMTWPATEVQRLGYDVEIVRPADRKIAMELTRGVVTKVDLPEDADVVVLQRVTNRYMAQAIPLARKRGIAVVVDIDDDLNNIHPSNPAYLALHPNNEGKKALNGLVSHHSWEHLNTACAAATLVTTSTPALLDRYAQHGRALVLRNYLAPHYYGVSHEDSDLVGWPASLHSHPNDTEPVGNAVARFVNERGGRFDVCCRPDGIARAFGLNEDPPGVLADTSIYEWPATVARLGVGLAPLANTPFNQAKSWLKPLEMSAVGVPWIASPRAEYAALNALGAGVLVDKPQHWFREIKRLAESEPRRRELAEAGRTVADTLRLSDHAWRWWEAWERALEVQRGRVRAATTIAV